MDDFYFVDVPITEYRRYRVEASSPEHAKELLLGGKFGILTDTQIEESLDSNTFSVESLSEILRKTKCELILNKTMT